MNRELEKARKKLNQALKQGNSKKISIALLEVRICEAMCSEYVTQAQNLLSFIQETVESKELEKLNQEQLTSLATQKWEEIKDKDGIGLPREQEKFVIETAAEALFLTFKNKEKFMKLIEEKLKEQRKNKNKKQEVL